MKQVTIGNPQMILMVLDYGAIVQKLLLKGEDGNYTNGVVGFDYPNDYLEDKKSLGACIGLRFDDSASLNEYRLQLNCSRYAETHENLLLMGQLHSVQQTDYDFLTEKPIGDIRLDGPLAIDLKPQTAGTVRSEKSGISMEVLMNQPA